MANDGLINSTVAKQAYDELQRLDDSLEKVYQNILKINGIKSNVPSVLGGASGQSVAAMQKLVAVREQSNKAIERERLAEIKLQQQREKAFDSYERGLAKEQAKLAASQSVYNKVQQKLNALNLEYRELAIQKEITGRLTDAESKRYTFLEGKIRKYDTTLKTVDASMGRYTRNVGNYTSGFNPLNNAINQLGREAPAFANSLQTGFMAISNNLPALFDALKGINDQNKQLSAQGKPTVSVFRQMAAAVFSLQTALSVGVTLLTIYGADIVSAFSGSSKVIDEHKDKVNQLQSTYTEQAVTLSVVDKAINDTTTSQGEFNNALKIAEQNGISLNAIEEARKGNLYLINKEIQDNIALSIRQAKAQALVQLIVENEIETAKKRRELGQSTQSTWRNLLRTLELVQTGTSGFDNMQLKAISDLENANKEYYDMLKELGLDSLIQDKKETQSKQKKAEEEKDFLASLYEYRKLVRDAEIRSLQELYDEQLKYYSEREDASNKINDLEVQGAEYRRLESLRILERQNQEETRELRRKLANNEITQANYNAVILSMEKDLRNKQDIVTEEYFKELYDATKNNTDRQLKLIQEEQKAREEYVEKYEGDGLRVLDVDKMVDDFREQRAEREKKRLKELRKETDDYLAGFVSTAFDEFGFKATYNLLKVQENGKTTFQNLIDGAESTGEAMRVAFTSGLEVIQEAYNFLKQNTQAQYDAMYSQLDQQKRIADGFATTEAAKAEIERQYEERRREIRRKELQAQKEQAIFNAVINTAQAVTASLPNIPLSVIVGALGAAQIALIAARDIPAYKDGTGNQTHPGGLALVGDGGKHELIWQPSKGYSVSPDTDTIMNLEKGSKVFPDLTKTGLISNGLPTVNNVGGQQLTEAQMRRAVKDGMKGTTRADISITKNGVRTHVITEQGKLKKMNNSANFKGTIL